MTVKTTVVAIAAALAMPATAQAHISVHPNTVPAGAFATLDVRVPGEQQGAHVTKVDTLFPSGFTSVAYQNVPGWKVTVVQRKLATPVQSDDGPIDSEVSQIIWTWSGPLGEVANSQFIDFPLSVAIPDDAAGKALLFKTVQSYSDGQTVYWIDTSLDAEHPAPTINITAPGGAIEDLAGDEAGPKPGQGAPTQAAATTPAAAKASSDGLAIAALIVAVFALVAGLAALIGTRRRAPASG